MSKERPRPRGGLVVPWAVLSLTLTAITIASLATLAVVSTQIGADGLSVVALALAVLSFAAQLIITVAQSWTASEQYRRSNRLYEQMRSVLESIRVQSEALLSNQRDQFDKILDHVLSPSSIESAVATVGRDGTEANGDSAEAGDSAITAEQVSRILREEAQRAFSADQAMRQPHARPVVDARIDPAELLTFPSEEEAAEALRKYRALSPEAKEYVQRQGSRIVTTGGRGAMTRTTIRQPVREVAPRLTELAAAGFITLEPARRGADEVAIRTFTPLGLIAARFFSGQGPIPVWLRDLDDKS